MNLQSRRRQLLDALLVSAANLMTGNVIDIGGKKENKRGVFRPPLSQVKSWKYVNIDELTKPDYCCSAECIPVDNGVFDVALLCEVIEHLEQPEKVLKECFRILKKDGILIASAPFLFPVHADPYDFQRWTETKINKVLNNIGYTEIDIKRMGGIGSVVHDLFLIFSNGINNKYARFATLLGLGFMKPFLLYIDSGRWAANKSITTGYFILARKQIE